MSMGIRISDQLMKEARVISTDNPDLTLNIIKEIMIGLEQLDEGFGSEYKFG